jgi:hypothetical protein
MSELGDAFSDIAIEWGQSASDIYSETCDVKRKAASGGAATIQTIHESVPCNVKAVTGGRDPEAIRAKTVYEVEMPGAIDGQTLNTVKSEDFITVAERGLQPERTYKVIDVAQDRGIKVFARCNLES